MEDNIRNQENIVVELMNFVTREFRRDKISSSISDVYDFMREACIKSCDVSGCRGDVEIQLRMNKASGNSLYLVITEILLLVYAMVYIFFI